MQQSSSSVHHLAFASIVFGMVFSPDASAQYVPRSERGAATARRVAVIDTNEIKASIHNFGFQGRLDSGAGTSWEWPKGTRREYLALSSIFVGGEVLDPQGDTLRIVSVAAFRSNPATGATWSFEPVPGYLSASSNQPARSDDPSSWPAVWPDRLTDSSDPGWAGSWNGLLGKNHFISGTEFYFHYADNLYDRYEYDPDSTDLTRRGLGIVIGERVLQWDDFILQDAMLDVYDIYNAGTRDIPRTAVTFWIADLVGGDGDSQDDRPTYDLTQHVIHFNDKDGISANPAFAGARVGLPNFVLLESPGEAGFINLLYLPAGSINFNTTPDSFFWTKFMTPGSYFDPAAIEAAGPADYDLFASIGRFRLPAGSSKRFIAAWALSDDTLNGNRKACYLKSFVRGGFDPHGIKVSILSPLPGQAVTGMSQSTWNARDNDPSLKTDLYFSTDDGDTWRILAEQQPNTGCYLWDPDTMSDGIFYKIQIVSYGDSGIGYAAMDSSFILNTAKSAAPQIRLGGSVAGEFFESPMHVQWTGGDADGDSVSVRLSYKLGAADWTTIADGLGGRDTYDWVTVSLPNAHSYSLQAAISAGADTAYDSTGLFSISNPRHGLSESAGIARTTFGTGLIEPRIVDSTKLTGHTYALTFTVGSDSIPRYDVTDATLRQPVLTRVTQVTADVEGPMFDGMRILVRNDPTAPDTASSHWNRAEVFPPVLSLFRSGFTFGVPSPDDVVVVMGLDGMDTTDAWTSPTGGALPAQPVNFTIIDLDTGKRPEFTFFERDHDGRFTVTATGAHAADAILLLAPVGTDSLTGSWLISMKFDSTRENPHAGDSLYFYLHRPFQTGDTYSFTALMGPLLGVTDHPACGFGLRQNYPNPFNPSTTIEFEVGSFAQVRLEIFDILGRRVRTLLDGRLEIGVHRAVWDGRNQDGVPVATGVYLCRLASGRFTSTSKLLLLR